MGRVARGRNGTSHRTSTSTMNRTGTRNSDSTSTSTSTTTTVRARDRGINQLLSVCRWDRPKDRHE